jgi:hypothetical protein
VLDTLKPLSMNDRFRFLVERFPECKFSLYIIIPVKVFRHFFFISFLCIFLIDSLLGATAYENGLKLVNYNIERLILSIAKHSRQMDVCFIYICFI